MPIKEIQLTNKQHAVPQNIMDVEFKLIGDLTMRQFAYLLVFGILAYVVYLTVFGIFKWPLVTFFSLSGLALAFVPVQERGMDEWVVNFFRSVYSPTQMVWKKSLILPSAFTYENLNVVRQELITLAPTSSRRKLEEYLNYKGVQQEVDSLDIPESEYILKVRAAFADTAVTTAPPVPQAPAAAVQPAQSEESAPEPVIKEERRPEPIIKTRLRPSVQESLLSAKSAISYTSELLPLTPDRHSGRKFTNLLPAEGRLILPIRGEKVLRTSEEKYLQEDQNKRVENLQKLLASIKESKEYKDVQFRQPPVSDVTVEARTIEKGVKQESEILNEQISKLKAELSAGQIPEAERVSKEHLLERLREQQKKASTDYAKLQRQILDLQKKVEDVSQPQTQPARQPAAVKFSKMQPITNEPNVISGVVHDDENLVMPGVVLLIKNSKGEPVRALKTNSLGQFIISTPLINGIYTAEVNSSPGKDITFDIISVEVKGQVIPPIEISGKKG